MLEKVMSKCRCGGRPRYRYSAPVHWVECRNKRCSMHTHYFPDVKDTFDTDAGFRAVEEWNKMMSK